MEKIKSPSVDRLTLLNAFVDFLKEQLKSELVSVVLFGSAAENRIRQSSDINLIVVLNSCQKQQLDKIKSEYRNQHNLIHLSCMYIEKSELATVCRLFPLKFLDISKRHQILHGENIITLLKLEPTQLKFQLQQTLMNLNIRLRERYALVSMREEQLVHIMNEFSGPLRSCAFSLMTILGRPSNTPKEALTSFLNVYFPEDAVKLSEAISTIREDDALAKDRIEPTYLSYMAIIKKMYALSEA